MSCKVLKTPELPNSLMALHCQVYVLVLPKLAFPFGINIAPFSLLLASE